jgi:hypothetical protein
MLVVATNPVQVEAQLAAGRFACPDCGERLSPWGFTRWRSVRVRHGVRRLRLRRATSPGCGYTHVHVPAWVTARRRDAVEVIGSALAMAAEGVGHRRIAARLDRPPETVRGWLRCARRHAPALRTSGARWWIALDPEPAPVQPAGSELADAVEAMMLAVRAWTLRSAPTGAVPGSAHSRCWAGCSRRPRRFPPSRRVLGRAPHDLIADQLRRRTRSSAASRTRDNPQR